MAYSNRIRGDRGENSDSARDWGAIAFIITRDKIDLVTLTLAESDELEKWQQQYLAEYRYEKKNKIWQKNLSNQLQKLSPIRLVAIAGFNYRVLIQSGKAVSEMFKFDRQVAIK